MTCSFQTTKPVPKELIALCIKQAEDNLPRTPKRQKREPKRSRRKLP